MGTTQTLTLEEAHEIVEQYDEHRAEMFAEAGSGALSLGYGTDGAYAAANEATAQIDDLAANDPELREARRVIAASARAVELLGVEQHRPGWTYPDTLLGTATYGACGIYSARLNARDCFDDVPF